MNTFERPIMYLLAAAALGYASWLLMTRRRLPDPARKKGWRLRFALATLASVTLLAGLFWKPVQPETFRKHSQWLEGKGHGSVSKIQGVERFVYEWRAIGRLKRAMKHLRRGAWVRDEELPLLTMADGRLYRLNMEMPAYISCYTPAFRPGYLSLPFERQVALKAIWMSLDPNRADQLRSEISLCHGLDSENAMMLSAYVELTRDHPSNIQNSAFENALVELRKDVRAKLSCLSKSPVSRDVYWHSLNQLRRLLIFCSRKDDGNSMEADSTLDSLIYEKIGSDSDRFQIQQIETRDRLAVGTSLPGEILNRYLEDHLIDLKKAFVQFSQKADTGLSQEGLELWVNRARKNPRFEMTGSAHVAISVASTICDIRLLPPMPPKQRIPSNPLKFLSGTFEMPWPNPDTVYGCIDSDGKLMAVDMGGHPFVVVDADYTWTFSPPPRPMWVKLKLKNGKPQL